MSDRSKPERIRVQTYDGPAGGYGSLVGLAKVAMATSAPPTQTAHQLLRQNKADGFACVSCAWPKPAKSHPAEFCENGAKATAWDLTSKRCAPDFFARHTVGELLAWSDYDLEQAGRLTHPMRYDAAADRYVPCAWQEAFAAIGESLRALDPTKVTFYASGRASLETSYMWALSGRFWLP